MTRTAPRPVHLQPGLLGVVGVGGVAGTAARYGVNEMVGNLGGWPAATLTVNVLGAFALGLLLETLLRRGEEGPRARRLRLGLGTGLLGGFTTYSALALELATMLGDGGWLRALLYATGSLALGLGAVAAGSAAAGAAHRRRVRRAADGTAGVIV